MELNCDITKVNWVASNPYSSPSCIVFLATKFNLSIFSLPPTTASSPIFSLCPNSFSLIANIFFPTSSHVPSFNSCLNQIGIESHPIKT